MTVKLEDNYFSDALKWTVVIVSALISGYLIFTSSYLWVVLFLLIISLITFSTKYSLIIDLERKQIMDSFYFLWIRIKTEEFKFMRLDGIRLDKQRHVYNASSRSRDHTADFSEYIATLEYDGDKVIELTRHMEYQSMAEEIKRIAGQLNLPVNRTF